MNKNAVSERLNILFKETNLPQSYIVKKTGINKGALSSYISGRYVPKQSNIYKLAKAFSVSPAWLMGMDVPKYDEKDWVFGTELEKIFQRISNELNTPIEEIKNIFLNYAKPVDEQSSYLNYENLYKFFLKYYTEIKSKNEKYAKVLKEKGLLDENENIDEKKIDKLLEIDKMMKEYNKKE